LGFRTIVATATPSPTAVPPSVVPAKMRSRAASYRAERSAKVPVKTDVGESSFAPRWVAATDRFRIRMGDWNAEAGGTTLGRDPVLDDVTTS